MGREERGGEGRRWRPLMGSRRGLLVGSGECPIQGCGRGLLAGRRECPIKGCGWWLLVGRDDSRVER